MIGITIILLVACTLFMCIFMKRMWELDVSSRCNNEDIIRLEEMILKQQITIDILIKKMENK